MSWKRSFLLAASAAAFTACRPAAEAPAGAESPTSTADTASSSAAGTVPSPDAESRRASEVAAGDVVPGATTTGITVPAGTRIQLRLENSVSSAHSRVGDRVVGRVTRDVVREGRTVVPAGSEMVGRVVSAISSGRVKGRARAAVDFDRVVIDGRERPLPTSRIDVVAPKSHERDAAIIGGSAVAGAVIGGLAGGRRGAGIGAAAGAGAGTGAVLLTKGKEVHLLAGSRWTVRVERTVTIG